MGTGLDTTFGMALESEYGVFKKPTRFLEVDSASIARKQNFTDSKPLRGRPGVPIARHRETTRWAEGSVDMELPNQGFGQILNLLHGEEVEAKKEGETKVYAQTHKIGVTPPNGKFATIQINKPTVEADNYSTYLGSKITNASFSCDTSAQLKVSLDFMAADLSTESEEAEATYATNIQSYDFTEATVKIDGEAIAAGLVIHSFNLVVPIPLHSQRWGLGHGAVQLEPIGFSDFMVPTVEFSCEFSNTEMFDYYVGGEEHELSVAFTGAKVEEKVPGITFAIPAVKFVGEDPSVSGPDVLDQTASIEVYDNITEPLVTATYVSTDAAL